MATALTDLGFGLPLIAAPMAGGPTTVAMVVAAARSGGMGLLAGGYKTPADLAEQIDGVRGQTDVFGVNLFAPNPVPVDRLAYQAYARAVQVDADRYGLQLTAEPIEDDDHWADKISLLLSNPVAVVSFTFGLPSAATVGALQAKGTAVVQTVTSSAEALLANDSGVDVLAVQAAAAGGHSGTLTPARPSASLPLDDLVREIRSLVSLPLIAAGGLATARSIKAVLAAGADAAMVGTVLLLTHESGASATYRTALADSRRDETVVTRAFTGRPARALRNAFTDKYGDLAPLGYPALHHLTSPLRRAAAAAGDPEGINLWAGTGHRHAIEEPLAATFARLNPG